MAVNSDLIGSEVFPCHARFTVADGIWSEVSLPSAGDSLALVSTGAILVSFDPDLSDGDAVGADAYEDVPANEAPTYPLGDTARAEKVFVAGNGAAATVCATMRRSD